MKKPKLLVILPRVPYPLEKGDKLRAYHFIKGLHKSFEISLFALSDQRIDKEIENEISNICDQYRIFNNPFINIVFNAFLFLFNGKPFQLAYFYRRSMKKAIRQEIKNNKPDVIFCQLLRSAEYVKGIDVKKVLDYQDAFSMGMKRRAETSGFLKKCFYSWESKRLRRYESKVSKIFDHTLIISEQDKKALPIMDKEAFVLRNGVDMNYYLPVECEKKYDLLFVGNMSYPPNINAVVYFAKEIMPLLLKNNPKLQFVIAGAKPHAKVKMLASDNIIITGWADDLREYYCRSKIFVAPMLIGTGLQNKLLEAMAMGIPCVTSSLANNALGAKTNKEIIIADTANEMFIAIEKLLENKNHRDEIAENGRILIQKDFSWENQIKQLKQKLEL